MPKEPEPTLTVVRADAVEVPGLRAIARPPKGRDVEAALGVRTLVLGSSPECDIVLDDARVSRRHAELSLTDAGVVIKDLESKTGTFIMAVRVFAAALPIGAEARLGGSLLTVRRAGQASLVPLSRGARFGEAIGASIPMRALFARLERAAPTQETILLLGESGTGKELLARGIHDQSPRKDGPFVVFDCSAVAPTLLEAELFGFVKGAFTGANAARVGLLEQANGGTLFIDEIGELPLELQPKLLRALEARQTRRIGGAGHVQFDARIVAATHRDLAARIVSREFREDLYYRLAVVEVLVPPLRERKVDIPLLVERFLSAHVPPHTLDDLPPNALSMLESHRWPGNVRELRNAAARLVLFPHSVEEAFARAGAPKDESRGGELTRLPLREAREIVIEQFERSYIQAKLRELGGNVSRAAEAMGVSRQLVHRLMERYGIRGSDERR